MRTLFLLANAAAAVLAFQPSAYPLPSRTALARTPGFGAALARKPGFSARTDAAALVASVASKSGKEMAAEAIGTGLITLLGTGVVSAAVYTGAHQGLWQISATWGVAVMMAAYTTAGVSGAHLNPAVTLALVVFKGFPLAKALRYVVAQLMGAIAGAVGVLACFGPAIKAFEASKAIARGGAAGIASAPGCMFYSMQPGGLSGLAACGVEGLQMAILMFVILSVTHKDSAAAPSSACAIIGGSVAVLVSVFGALTCGGFNPARDMGPRIVACLAGWGTFAFKHAWVYSLGPFIGALIGAAAHAAVYDSE